MTDILNNIGNSNLSWRHWRVMTSMTAHLKIWHLEGKFSYSWICAQAPFSLIYETPCAHCHSPCQRPLWDRTHWLMFEFPILLLIILIKTNNSLQRSADKTKLSKVPLFKVYSVQCSDCIATFVRVRVHDGT